METIPCAVPDPSRGMVSTRRGCVKQLGSGNPLLVLRESRSTQCSLPILTIQGYRVERYVSLFREAEPLLSEQGVPRHAENSKGYRLLFSGISYPYRAENFLKWCPTGFLLRSAIIGGNQYVNDWNLRLQV